MTMGVDRVELSGKVCLVTGAGGFIGSHLTEFLVEQGADVRAFVHYNALNAAGWLDSSAVRDRITVYSGDISDRDSLREAMTGAEIVFHLAALIAIPYSYSAPESYLRTNVFGTLNVLQLARELGVKRVIHTSTSEVYGTARSVPITEAHPLQGQSPYSASKIGADKIAEAFHLSYEVPVVTVRPFNTFGPRQSARAVIPTVITQCLRGTGVIHLGSTSPTRDLNFVRDTVRGFALAATAPRAAGETVNLGSGREISVGELAYLIAELCGQSIEIHTEEARLRPEASEVERLLADNRKASEILEWLPETSLEEGLVSTIEWYRANLDRFQPGVYVT